MVRGEMRPLVRGRGRVRGRVRVRAAQVGHHRDEYRGGVGAITR